MLRVVQVITGVVVVGLSVASAVLLLLSPRSSSPHQISHEPVPLLNVVSGLLLSVLIIINSIIIGYIQLSLQLVISLVYIVSGILQVVTTPSTSHTIIFIVDVIFITSSMLISSINYLQPLSLLPPSSPQQQHHHHQQDEESTIGSTIHQDEKYTYKLSTPNNPIRTSISTPNFVTHQTKKNNNKVQTSNSLSTLVSASTNNISRDPSSLLMLEVDDEEEQEEDVTDIVRRSKSMIVSRKVKRWKSIHEEKAFLSNVNDCLLPPVLKGNKEKSPIQEQQEIQDLPYIAEFDES
ncbi:uncharacterized protein SPAPADRAFT_63509, partial [Spathaspora passalidarum NRRL Y-27907]